ncbi:MAG: hypothetical protein AAGD22_02965 [Verrucomicrobiota bacterium]
MKAIRRAWLIFVVLGLMGTGAGCVKRQIQVPTMTPPYVQPGGYGDDGWGSK